MTKTLLLLRHAKSSWDRPELEDFDRPLAPRGQKAAKRMAKLIRDEGLQPALVLCSAARRTQETWDIVASKLGESPPVKVQKSLYLAPPTRLLAAVRRVSQDVPSVMLIGHNPGMEGLAARLCGPESKRGALLDLQAKFPTAALAVIAFEAGSWAEVQDSAGTLVRFVKPRDLS